MAKQYNDNRPDLSFGGIIAQAGEFLTGLDFNIEYERTGLLNNLWDEFSGYNSQQREFEQQEYLMDKENAYNTPAAQMERLRAAGIDNAHAAQAVIGGNAVESAQAPGVASAAGAPAAAAGAVASGAEAVNTMSLQSAQKKDLLASASQKNADATEKLALLDARKELLVNQGAHELIKMGLTTSQAYLMSAKTVYADINERLDVYAKMANLSKIRKEIDVLEQERRKKIKEVDILDKENQMKEIDLWFQNERKRVYEANGYDMLSAFDMALLEMDSNGHIQEFEDFLYNRSYSENKGQFDSEVDAAFEKFYNETLGKNAANAEYAEYKQFFDLNEYWIKSTIDIMSKQTCMSPIQVLQWVMQALVHAFVGNDAIDKPDKPLPMPYDSGN